MWAAKVGVPAVPVLDSWRPSASPLPAARG